MEVRSLVSKKGWDKLTFHDPERVLIEFRKLEIEIINSDLPEKVKNLRTKQLKKHLEGRQGALFCHGLKTVLGVKVLFSNYEYEDYDIVTVHGLKQEQLYTPVQLKEIVPHKINPKASFDTLVNSLKKYTDSNDLIVAIHWNQTGQFKVPDLKIPRLNISELWIYGAINEEQSKWFLIGDLLKDPNYFEFEYPK